MVQPGLCFSMLARGAGRGYAAALGLVAAVSVLIGIVLSVVPIANISILYLLAVLAAAVRYGRGPAITAAFAAFLTFNWFFVEPVHTFAVHRAEEVLALVVLLLAAVVIGQLAARERARRREAEAREREAVLLGAMVAALSEGGATSTAACTPSRSGCTTICDWWGCRSCSTTAVWWRRARARRGSPSGNVGCRWWGARGRAEDGCW